MLVPPNHSTQLLFLKHLHHKDDEALVGTVPLVYKGRHMVYYKLVPRRQLAPNETFDADNS